MTRMRQTFTVTVTTKGQSSRPSYFVHEALHGQDGVADFRFTADGPAVVLPGPNRERLIGLAVWAAGEQAKAELGLPSEWDQRDWIIRSDCGTACCIAGKVALEDGGVPVRRDSDWATAEVGSVFSQVTLPGLDEPICVDEYARKALGLTRLQAERLFSANNELRAVLATIRQLLAEDEPDSEPAEDAE